MAKFTVYLPGGGSEQVNASSASAALGNVGGGASLSPQTSSSSGGGGGGGGASAAPAPSSSGSGGAGQFQTVNGLQTLASMTQQLQKAGWPGNPNDPSAVVNAYSSTTGGSVTPAGSSLPSFNNGSAPGQTAGAVQQGGLSAQDKQDILNAFGQSSGFSLQELAEKKRQFDATLDWQKQMWQQQGLPQLVIAQKAQALAEQEFQAQTALAQSNLGLDYLKTASTLTGPSDYFQEDDFLRGARQRGDVPVFLKALSDNTQLGNGAATGTPTPQSAEALAARLTGAGSVPSSVPAIGSTGGANGTGTNTTAALGSIAGIMAKGGSSLAPGELEQLNPDEMNLLQSGANKLGFSMPAFLQQYQQSRIGQGSAQAA